MLTETVNYTQHNFRIKTRSLKKYTMSSHHFHDSYEIYYMNTGSRNYFITDSTYPIQEGDLVLIKPHDLHKTIDTGNSHSRVLISFHPDFFSCPTADKIINSCFSTSRVITPDSHTKETIEVLLKQLIVEADQQNLFYTSNLKNLLTQFLILTSRFLKAESKSNVLPHSTNQKVFEVANYLKSNYTQNITLDELADTFYISRYYLTRLFKKHTGFTIFEFIHSLRVIEAQKLLLNTDLKIIEIAEMVGYTNLSSFGKTFKSISGMSPLSYRKKRPMK